MAIGDLNASLEAWHTITQGLGLVDDRGAWTGGDTHLVQLGDVFNRGAGARSYFEDLVELQKRAADAGGQVTQLLGNHEVLTALGIEAYCTTEEYLAWATDDEKDAWEEEVREYLSFLLMVPPPGPVLPLAPRMEAWKALNVPGRRAMRVDLGPDGALRALLATLPVAVVAGDCVFSHAPITPRWARLGLAGLNERAQREWKQAPSFYRSLPPGSLFRASQGPLWNRQLVLKETVRVRRQLLRSLSLFGVARMVTGHTTTESMPGGSQGHIQGCHGGRLWSIDVGLGSAPPAALVIDGDGGWQWSLEGRVPLWGAT